MARIHLLHGFNVSDGGAGSVGRLVEPLAAMGYAVVVHDLGWAGLLSVSRHNAAAVALLLPLIAPDDHIIAHSNGTYVAHRLVEAGLVCASITCIQPALRRDTVWGAGVGKLLCLFNDQDWVVRSAQWWRYTTYLNPWRWRQPHGWGAAGFFGFTEKEPRLTQWQTNTHQWVCPVQGHSGVFTRPANRYWGEQIAGWLKALPTDKEG